MECRSQTFSLYFFATSENKRIVDRLQSHWFVFQIQGLGTTDVLPRTASGFCVENLRVFCGKTTSEPNIYNGQYILIIIKYEI